MKYPEPEIYLNKVFKALKSSDRRQIIGYLDDNLYARGEELINYLESQNRSNKDLKAVLHHSHLPKLKNTGWIDYDKRPRSVEDYDIRFEIDRNDGRDAIIIEYLNQLEDSDEQSDKVFDALMIPNRRRTIHWLREEQNKSNLSQIATYLAADSSDQQFSGNGYKPSEEELNLMRLKMTRLYLPMLEEAGLVEFDELTEKLSLSEEFSDPDNLLIEFLEQTYDRAE